MSSSACSRTLCTVFQSEVVKLSVDCSPPVFGSVSGSTAPESALLTVSVTAADGCRLSRTSKLPSAPPSVRLISALERCSPGWSLSVTLRVRRRLTPS